MSADSVTILRSLGPLATKRIRRDAEGNISIEPYSDAKHWAVRSVQVDGIGSLASAIEEASSDPRTCLIRGEPVEGINPTRCRRLLYADRKTGEPATFHEVPRFWVLLDFDGVEPDRRFDPMDGELQATSLVARHLPRDFRGRSFWWSFTSSAGLPGTVGLRMRIAFWLSRAVDGAELERWLTDCPVDLSLFRTVQVHYVATPLFSGMGDPIKQRSGIVWDFHDIVVVPELAAPAPEPRQPFDFNRRNLERLFPGGFRAFARRTPEQILEDACAKVARSPAGGRNLYGSAGRHTALFCAGLRMSGLVRDGKIPRRLVLSELLAAAEFAGLKGERDIIPHIERGLAHGGAA